MRASPRASWLVKRALSTRSRVVRRVECQHRDLRSELKGRWPGPQARRQIERAGPASRICAALPDASSSIASNRPVYAMPVFEIDGERLASICPIGKFHRPARSLRRLRRARQCSCAADRRSRGLPRTAWTAEPAAAACRSSPSRAASIAAYCSAAWRYLRWSVTSARPTAGMFMREFAQFERGDGFTQGRVRQRLAEVRDQARLVVFGERLQVEPEGGVERQQHRHGQRPLIVFKLVEIAERNPELLASAACVSRCSSRRRFSRTPMKVFFIASSTSQTLQIDREILRKTTLFQSFSKGSICRYCEVRRNNKPSGAEICIQRRRQTSSRRDPARRVVFPDRANHYGTLFGGHALSLMGKAAFIAATRHARQTW